MSRKSRAIKREVQPDPRYNDTVVTKFINSMMRQGRRSTSEGILYECFEIIQGRTGEEGIKVFKKALDNVKPLLEVRSRRVGGANYQIPMDVKPDRRQSLANRWIVEAARSRGEKSMAEKLANELLEASNGRGSAMKKREDVHKMADANKAFAHFKW